MLWDRGHGRLNLNDVDRALKTGYLKFKLNGKAPRLMGARAHLDDRAFDHTATYARGRPDCSYTSLCRLSPNTRSIARAAGANSKQLPWLRKRTRTTSNHQRRPTLQLKRPYPIRPFRRETPR